ncbi:MAG: lipopolysaccharide transport periplasmic protein LptA [Methylococcaceae bacterium]|nr:lipopolysaccharide transport periplasmic protein LptA [Methylococcaceae bacterium]
MNKWFLGIFFASIITFCMSAYALESDNKQPITIESDSGFYDDKKGLSTYAGKVVIIQGSMRLDADKVEVYLENREIKKMVATGAPVKFQQTPEAGKEDVHGNSLIAEYYPKTEVLVMIQKAVIWQGGNSTASERIEYDRVSEVVKAGQTGSSSNRVHVILQPKSKSSK